MRTIKLILFVAAVPCVIGCTKTSSPPPSPVDRGRAVYTTHCTSCHNMNPKLDGAIGPAVSGSSLELLQVRILKQSYPEGYKPKRETHIMPALPFMKDDLPALHAYLNSQ